MVIQNVNFGGYDDWDDEPPTPPRPATQVRPQAAAEPSTIIGAKLPEVIVVPAHPRPDDDGFSIELSAEVTGAPVAIVFSTVERLIERLGRYQPWVMVPSAVLPQLLCTAAISIVLDPLEKTCRTWWSSARLAAMHRYQNNIETAEANPVVFRI
ncbi:SAV_915 family protein [Nocardia sp. CDC160]|uniref:SAV_915 family protein n=1 Tax=Nocardia sp. CDC160 TaxID=3112166 RepID=UPI002DBAA14A|nr:SAV_915 family protein [Nocardia sp. CDC160]MEC3915476.1 SAV_915 family protein [Nocardia sp. CDC160]